MPPQKIKQGGHFGVLKGMWVFQNVILHRQTNYAKSQPKLGLRSTSSNAIMFREIAGVLCPNWLREKYAAQRLHLKCNYKQLQLNFISALSRSK